MTNLVEVELKKLKVFKFESEEAKTMLKNYGEMIEKKARLEERELMMKLWAQEYGNNKICYDCYKLFLKKLEELEK